MFDDPAGEALFMCDRYQVLVMPLDSAADPEAVFALRVDEATDLFTAMGRTNVGAKLLGRGARRKLPAQRRRRAGRP
ncbi:hypothetical protein [Enhygromyxa salina]|nr:hypothetical protein [Enhygromyxa salina]